MLVTRIHVVSRREPQLGGVGWSAAGIRVLGYFLCWLTVGIGFLFGLHDKVAGTEAVIVNKWALRYPQSYAPAPSPYFPPPPAIETLRRETID
jgi:hypothetical protein